MNFQAELGPAQITILKGLANGLSPRQLAAELGFSEHAVAVMLRCARDMLGARSEIQAVILYDRQSGGR
ncbi:LuxR C-terminal-related transcriptional regulator [Zhengella sp. ZM62]|uniref:LuxR C-terminal-related transcriptional regulator n=1 Tax=Zhengella sedimenti TaxID=3390035 RepID=UPI0039750988